MTEVAEHTDEEFPGSVGPTAAVDDAAIDAAPSGVSLSGGQSFLVAGVGLVSVLAVVIGLVVLIRIGTDENRGGVAATEFAFDPATAEMPVGEEVTVTMDNVGSVEHEWIVLNEGVRIGDEAEFSEDMVLARTERVQGGESSTVSFTLDATGTYQVVCLVAGHLAAGMQGTVTASA